MTHRERFINLFSGKKTDRVPFIDYMGTCNFKSCLERWKREGLAADADFAEVRRIAGFDYVRGFRIDAKYLFYPEFEVALVRRESDKTFVMNKWGGLEIKPDNNDLMPITLEGPVRDRKTWEAVKSRLAGSINKRFTPDFDKTCAEAGQSDLPVYSGDLPAGFFGAPREILGPENLLYLYYDDPVLMEEILDTLCELWISICDHIQQKVKLDYFFVWEDMCCKTGPLIGPKLFREFLLPRYRRLTAALRNSGCAHIIVDSDGDVRQLVPLWLEGGVNVIMPWESQFGLDLHEVRKQYPALGIIGGINKRVLEFDRDAMDRELDKIPYMLEKGYFIPSCDHGVTNDVSWSNYLYFYEKLRELIDKYPPGL